MKWQRAMLVPAAMLLGIAGTPDGWAGPGAAPAGRSGHGGAHHPGNTARSPASGRYVAPYRASYPYAASYWGAPLAYGYSAGYAPTYAPARAAPALYYVPPLSPNAPPFSFDGSPAVELDWGWQRVNLQQLAAEVRAKRGAGARP
jgi:hypothetical protein